jgi:hypothetical protein
MFEDKERMIWDATDIKMAIKRYFYALEREDHKAAMLEFDFLNSIHHEWSYNPLMRRCNTEVMVLIDEFLKWLQGRPVEQQSINDFTIRRLLRGGN